jgi:hypothetical protein
MKTQGQRRRYDHRGGRTRVGLQPHNILFRGQRGRNRLGRDAGRVRRNGARCIEDVDDARSQGNLAAIVLLVNGAEREQAVVVVVGLRDCWHGDDDACDFGVRPFPRLVLIDSLFYFGYLHL